MKERIAAIGKVFNSTHQLIISLDPTLEGDKDVIITKEDRKVLKLYYDIFDMKRFNIYLLFEESVKDYAVKRGLLPTSAAMELCAVANKIKLEDGD